MQTIWRLLAPVLPCPECGRYTRGNPYCPYCGSPWRTWWAIVLSMLILLSASLKGLALLVILALL